MYWVAQQLDLMDSRAGLVSYLIWSAALLELPNRNPSPRGAPGIFWLKTWTHVLDPEKMRAESTSHESGLLSVPVICRYVTDNPKHSGLK